MDKITLLRTDDDGHGTLRHRVLYWYDLAAAPVLDAKGTKIVVRKATELPDEAALYATAADRAALNAGDADFEVLFREQTRGETRPALATRLLAEHAARGPEWVAMRRQQFADAGRGVN